VSAPAHGVDAQRHRGRRIDMAANAWARSIVNQLVSGSWTPWANWLTDAFESLPGAHARRTRRGLLPMWHNVREAVLDLLSELELTATVMRTDSPVPVQLEDHHADMAGLVHVHRHDAEFAYAPPIPSHLLIGSAKRAVHARAMLTRYDLLPAQMLLPLTLRGFCGQHADDNDGTTSFWATQPWHDHLRVWTTLYGEPVMTVEPYPCGVDEAELAGAIRAAIARAALPLVVDGPYPGAWADRTSLFFIRHDPTGCALPAVFEPQQADVVWRKGHPAATFVNGRRVKR
jgi:hypothetical protein